MTPPPMPRRALLVVVALVAVTGLLAAFLLARPDTAERTGSPDPITSTSTTSAPAPAGPDPAVVPGDGSDPVADPPPIAPERPADEPADPTPESSGPAPVEPAVEVAIAADGEAPVLVGLDVPDGLTPEEREPLVAAAAAEVLAGLPSGSVTEVKPTGTTAVLALTVDAVGLDALRQSGPVVGVGEDGINTIESTNSPVSVQADQLWTKGLDGVGQVVAVLDTGVARDHPYLATAGASDVLDEACFSTNLASFSSNCPGGTTEAFGAGVAAPCAAPVSACRHGTHVAGIVAGGSGAASMAPASFGASGIAPGAGLLAVQVFSSYGSGAVPSSQGAFDSDIIRALDWVYAQRAVYPGLSAVNLSLGGGRYADPDCDDDYPAMKGAIDDLRDVGIATVVAAGNRGWRGTISGPACISSAVAVGWVDDATLTVSDSSNLSAAVDLLAPGSSIRSSFPPDAMGDLSGTSMATPAVSGAFALMKEARPGATVDQLEFDLESTGRATDAPGVGGGTLPYLQIHDAVGPAWLQDRPGPPSGVSGSPGAGEVAVSWSAPGTTGSSAVTGYTVTTTPGGATCTTAGQLGCVVTGLTNGQTYEFAVRAVNGAGPGPAAGSSPIAPFTVPAAVPSVTGFGGSGAAILSWSPPTFDGGRPILGYTATALPGGATCTSSGELGCVVQGLTDGQPYTFTVTASNVAGPGPASPATAPVVPAPASMAPLAPARLMDTRVGQPTVDGQFAGAGVVGPGQVRDLTVIGRGGVPVAGVGAVALNVTVTEPSAWSFLTVFPKGAARPTASNLNFGAGQTVPNMVIAKVGDGGQVSFFNQAGSTHVVVDVLGWFPEAVGYASSTPARLMDTRVGQPTVDGQFAGAGVVGPGQVRDLTVIGRGGVPVAGVGAVALNVTVTEPSAWSFLTVFPKGAARPTASNLNFGAGQTVPNMVIAKVGDGGQVSFFNQAGSTHVVVDVLGWFPEAVGYASSTPARLMDTRVGQPTVDGQFAGAGVVGPGQVRDLTVIGRGGVPVAGVGAVALNVTVTEPSAWSFLTVFPKGAARPTASNLNFGAGQTVPNMVIAKVGDGGQVSFFNQAGSTHVVVDVLGWFPE